MNKVFKKTRDLVLPGELVVESMDYLPGRNCFREGNGIYSKRLGLVYFKGRVVEVVPLAGPYIPEVGDMVIGEIKEVQYSGWIVDINSPYQAFLPISGIREFVDSLKTDISKIYNTGDVIYGKISVVSALKTIYISMKEPQTRKFSGGRIVEISPVKVPRLIGKGGSMINLIKNKTKCRISVGQNGRIWLQGEKEELAVKAIMMVNEKSHTTGLTEAVERLLDRGE
ncbi:MAG TPA: RNA-binding protein [Candidatus Aenigmarchaeota archaeon]|nr:MAG: RNA-binding protein [Candidatus Aenigmarchaeota archaeon]HDD46131.1 RNA-binding protein [Candidatus Aenigmarchaeota archaeon]